MVTDINSEDRLVQAAFARHLEEELGWDSIQAEVKSLILDHVFATLPDPPFTDLDKQGAADRLFQHVWQLSASGGFGAASAV